MTMWAAQRKGLLEWVFKHMPKGQWHHGDAFFCQFLRCFQRRLSDDGACGNFFGMHGTSLVGEPITNVFALSHDLPHGFKHHG
jgi:hypothetical protein